MILILVYLLQKLNRTKINQIQKNSVVCNLVRKRDYNAKIVEIEGKMPSINGLATTTALTAVKNKIPDVSNLVKKTDYDVSLSDIDSKYITTADYNKFTKNFVDNNIKSKNLVNKSAISGFINNTDLDKKKYQHQ